MANLSQSSLIQSSGFTGIPTPGSSKMRRSNNNSLISSSSIVSNHEMHRKLLDPAKQKECHSRPNPSSVNCNSNSSDLNNSSNFKLTAIRGKKWNAFQEIVGELSSSSKLIFLGRGFEDFLLNILEFF
jgi:hypothetical protein